MADEKKRIIQLPALDLADVPVGAFFPVDSATDEQDPNTGVHKVPVSDVLDAIGNAIETSEQAEQAVQDLADDVETLSEECARNDIIATPYIEDGSVHGYRANAIVTHANKLYQNQTGGILMQIDFNPNVWTEITVGDYINTLCEDFAEEWASSQSYDVGDIVIQAGQLYRCKRATSASSISSSDWDEITVVDLLSEGGRVQDVYVNGTSVVDLNKIAQIKSYKEVTQAEYDALPSSKLTDNILYCIKDGGVDIVNDVRRNGTSIVNNGVADIAVDTNPTQHSTNLVTSGGVYNAITPMQQQIGWLASSIEAELYNGSNTYNVGDYVWQNGSNATIILYKCIATTTGSWDSSKWEPVTVTSELETKADKTYVDESIDKQLVHGTASGDIATFNDGSNLPMPSLKVGIEPQQDLHGYDNPWVGGAGKNKLPNTATSQTKNGITFTVNNDGSVNVNGTSTANTTLLIANISDTNLVAGTEYILNGCPNGDGNYSIAISDDLTTTYSDWRSGVTFTLSNDFVTNNAKIRIVISANTTVSNKVFKPMIRLASVTDATFAPYSNICPISGWDEADVSVCGKNFYSATLADYSSSQIAEVGLATFYPVKVPYGTYTISTNAPTGYIWAGTNIYDSSTLPRVYEGNPNTVTTDIIWVGLLTTDKSSAYAYNIMINQGSTPSTYEPYNGATYTIQFKDGDNPLTVYGGSLDVVSGVLTVDRYYQNLGDLTWVKITNERGDFFVASGLPNIKTPDNSICSQYKLGNPYGSNDDAIFYAYQGGTSCNVLVRDSRYTDTASFKQAMNGVQLVYELATPTTIQLTPTQVKSLLGSNNVWADTGEILEANYIRCLDITINDLISRIEALEG